MEELAPASAYLRVEKRQKIERLGIRCQRLVVPVEGTAPINDLVDRALGLVEHLLEHQVVIGRRHAPDDRLDRTALDGTLGEVFWRETVLSVGRNRQGKLVQLL